MLMAADALGRPFVVSKQVPADRMAALRTAFDATMKDGQFLAETQKMDLPVEGPITGLEAEQIVASIYAAVSCADCARAGHRRQIAPAICRTADGTTGIPVCIRSDAARAD